MGTSLEAARDELVRGLGGLLDRPVPVTRHGDSPRRLGRGRHADELAARSRRGPAGDLAAARRRGLRDPLRRSGPVTVIAGNTELGALYGTFAFLRLMQTQKPITGLDVPPSPKIKHRHLNYWETERLYAGNNAAGHRRAQRRERGGLQLRRHRRERRREPAGDPRPLHRRGAGAGLARHQRHHDQQRQRQQRLPDARRTSRRRRRWPTRCARTGSRLALSINYTAPTDTRFAPDTLTNAQLDPYSAEFRGWWRRKAQQIQAVDPGLHRASPSRPTPRASPARRTSATTTGTAPTASPPRSRRWA